MWQPGKKQWRVIWPLALFIILAWPAENGSLGLKTMRWMVDPHGTLPYLPPPLSMELDDNADAVAEHDAVEQEYYRVMSSSSVARTRLRIKELRDPFELATQRQLLVGLAVIGALVVWRVEDGKQGSEF